MKTQKEINYLNENRGSYKAQVVGTNLFVDAQNGAGVVQMLSKDLTNDPIGMYEGIKFIYVDVYREYINGKLIGLQNQYRISRKGGIKLINSK